MAFGTVRSNRVPCNSRWFQVCNRAPAAHMTEPARHFSLSLYLSGKVRNRYRLELQGFSSSDRVKYVASRDILHTTNISPLGGKKMLSRSLLIINFFYLQKGFTSYKFDSSPTTWPVSSPVSNLRWDGAFQIKVLPASEAVGAESSGFKQRLGSVLPLC